MKINPVLVMTLLFSGLYGTRLPAEDTGPPVEPAATPAEATMPDISGNWEMGRDRAFGDVEIVRLVDHSEASFEVFTDNDDKKTFRWNGDEGRFEGAWIADRGTGKIALNKIALTPTDAGRILRFSVLEMDAAANNKVAQWVGSDKVSDEVARSVFNHEWFRVENTKLAEVVDATMPDIAGVWKDLNRKPLYVWHRKGIDTNPYQVRGDLTGSSTPMLLTWNREYRLFEFAAQTPDESSIRNERTYGVLSSQTVWKYIADRRVIYSIHFSYRDEEDLRTMLFEISKPTFDEKAENLSIEDFPAQVFSVNCFAFKYQSAFDRLEGTDLVISETAGGLSGFSKSLGRWTGIEVPLPKDGSPRILNCQVGKNLAAAVIDNQALCYSSETGKWGRMTIPEDFVGKVQPLIGADLASMQIGDTYFTFSPQTGEWTSPEGTPADDGPMGRGSASPTDSVRSAVGHKDSNHPTFSNKYLNVLLFHATYSSPCAKMVAAATTLRNQGYYIRLINIDEHAELARRFEVMKLPTTILMKEGNESEEEALRIVGLMSKEKFREFVVKYLKPEPSLVPQDARQLTSRIHQHEFEAHKLAQQLRLKSMNFGSDHPDILALREQLEGELAAALELRFQREELQVTDLQKRLKAVTEQIQRRKAVKQKILDRRLQELIDDDGTRWDREASGETPEATGEVGELDQSASQSETERPPLTSRIRITGP